MAIFAFERVEHMEKEKCNLSQFHIYQVVFLSLTFGDVTNLDCVLTNLTFDTQSQRRNIHS